MEDLVNLFVSNGMSVAIIIYFLYKDYKFNDLILAVLAEVKDALFEVKNVLSSLEAWHSRNEQEKR